MDVTEDNIPKISGMMNVPHALSVSGQVLHIFNGLKNTLNDIPRITKVEVEEVQDSNSEKLLGAVLEISGNDGNKLLAVLEKIPFLDCGEEETELKSVRHILYYRKGPGDDQYSAPATYNYHPRELDSGEYIGDQTIHGFRVNIVNNIARHFNIPLEVLVQGIGGITPVANPNEQFTL